MILLACLLFSHHTLESTHVTGPLFVSSVPQSQALLRQFKLLFLRQFLGSLGINFFQLSAQLCFLSGLLLSLEFMIKLRLDFLDALVLLLLSHQQVLRLSQLSVALFDLFRVESTL